MPRQKSVVRLVSEPLLIAVLLAAGVRAAVSIYSIPSASMLPSLEIGDHILVTPYRWSSPARGDVVVFRAPSDGSQLMVKRVIGLPGDLIDCRAGRVRIGEHTIPEPYLLKQAASGAISAQVVPPDSFFVMGDNREDSLDSRRWGTLSRDLVIGRVRVVLWSSAGGDHPAEASTMSRQNRRTSTVRLSRIFKCVE
ncbi:MAG TPA: signal peptidase I [Thermoanaerobaculia bacterium]|jgi:signal peptidase I|nr:signal peptidase I [Thermoanaerobaculia bacterium]